MSANEGPEGSVDHDDVEFTNDNLVQLRDAHKTLKKEAKELRQFKEQAEPQLRRHALSEAGFDPDSGPAKALLKLHDGELTPEAIRQTATEYELAPSEGDGEPSGGGELPDEQQAAIDSHRRGEQLAAGAAPAEPQTDTDALAEAYAKGDLQAAYAINERRYRAQNQ